MTPKFKPPIAIVANGSAGDPDFLKNQLSQYQTIIAVDGGLNTCCQLKISPHFIIGDMDSVTPELLALYPQTPQKTYPVIKNKSDLELAILSVKEQNIDRATIFCALKMRNDHSLYNLYLLKRFKEMLTIETEQETLFVVTGNRTISCAPGQTISLIPLGKSADGVTSSGLKWELNRACIDEKFMSISNVCLGTSFSISIHQGALLCFLIK